MARDPDKEPEYYGLLVKAWAHQGDALSFATRLAAEGHRGYMVDGRSPGASKPHSLALTANLDAATRRARAYRQDCEEFQAAGVLTVIDLGNGRRPPKEVLCLHASVPERE